MKRIDQVLLVIGLASAPAIAQEYTYTYKNTEPAYTFKTVLRPGMTIPGHTFGPNDTIGSAAINETGEVALIAHWLEYPKDRTGVFTLHRMVAKEGDAADFADISYISLNARIAINVLGTVAYEAVAAQNDFPAIFIERTVAMSMPSPNPSLLDFALGDDGELIMRDKPSCAKVNLSAETLAACAPLAMLASNHRGQVVIPINTPQGPFLLVGTPER